jgi:hypothetical protein
MLLIYSYLSLNDVPGVEDGTEKGVEIVCCGEARYINVKRALKMKLLFSVPSAEEEISWPCDGEGIM